MGQLTEIKNNNVFCDSRMVAEKFGYDHNKVVRVIDRIIGKLDRFNPDNLSGLNTHFPEFVNQAYGYRGRVFKYYEMNKTAFSLLAMRFETDRAFEWQLKFVQAFEIMERRLLDVQNNKNDATWRVQREQGKLVRLTAMDTVKDFVEYATAQGSENAKFYYKHITVACYRCLQLIEAKKPKLRDTLDTLELHQLMMAEIVAERSIRRHMDAGEHYKAIFSLVKIDLERFAESLMIGYQKQIAA